MHLPEARDDIIENIKTYVHSIEHIDSFDGAVRESLLQTVSRTMGWLLAYRNGNWMFGPTKFCAGAADMTPERYHKKRRGRLNPSAAKNIITDLFFEGDDDWRPAEVDDKHPGAKALRALAKSAGKDLRSGTRFYLLPGESIGDEERAEVERLLNLMDRAKLTPNAVRLLVSSIISRKTVKRLQRWEGQHEDTEQSPVGRTFPVISEGKRGTRLARIVFVGTRTDEDLDPLTLDVFLDEEKRVVQRCQTSGWWGTFSHREDLLPFIFSSNGTLDFGRDRGEELRTAHSNIHTKRLDVGEYVTMTNKNGDHCFAVKQILWMDEL